MVDQAKAFEAEDKDKREVIEARNNLDNLIYQVEKSLTENGDKLPEADKSNLEADVAKAREALDSDDKDALKAAFDSLQAASHKLAEVMYQQGQSGDDAAAPPADDSGSGDDVIEAEYEDA